MTALQQVSHRPARWGAVVVIVAAAAMALSLLAAAMGAEIRLQGECHCARPLVLLGDVAEVYANDEQQAAALRAVELFPAPSPEQLRVVTAREVSEILDLRQVNLNECRLSGARRTLVYGLAPNDEEPRRLSARPIQLRATASNSATKITDVDITPPVPPANIPSEIKPARQVLRATPASFSKEIKANAATPVVVAARALKRGDVVQAADVRLETPSGSPSAPASVRRIEDAIGKELVRPVAPSQPIDAGALQRPLLVKRGEIVSVSAVSKGVRVRTTGKAAQDGAQGESISVQIADRRETIIAQVVGPQQVQVDVSGR